MSYKPVIYLENAAQGLDGFTTHLMSYTLCISLSKFLDRPFYFDYEVPCSTPPEFATRDEFKDKFGILLESPRSIVSQLVDMPANRVFEIDREVSNKAAFQLLSSYFVTTEGVRRRFENTIIWQFFGFGRHPLIREELQSYDLIEWTHSNLTNPSCFYFLPRAEKDELLRSVRIKFINEIEALASAITNQVGRFNAVHIRLGDFLTNYGSDEYQVDIHRYKAYVAATFEDRSLPILIATDGLYEKVMFAEIFSGYKTIYIDEFIFDDFRGSYEALPWIDFSSLVILNELICAAGELFIGTFRSTFTGMIHRLRQERYGRKDFNFFPDGRIAKLLGPDMKIKADGVGFFDWNRFSQLTPDVASLSWRREWDFDLTSIDY